MSLDFHVCSAENCWIEKIDLIFKLTEYLNDVDRWIKNDKTIVLEVLKWIYDYFRRIRLDKVKWLVLN